MIDVIVYSYDYRGFLTLQERRFAGHGELSSYLGSPKSAGYLWAEVEGTNEHERYRMVRCIPDALKAKAKSPRRVYGLKGAQPRLALSLIG